MEGLEIDRAGPSREKQRARSLCPTERSSAQFFPFFHLNDAPGRRCFNNWLRLHISNCLGNDTSDLNEGGIIVPKLLLIENRLGLNMVLGADDASLGSE
jgi:hypothetical protein